MKRLTFGNYLRLAGYHPGLLVSTMLLWILFSLAPLAIGYASQQVFDALTGDAQLDFSVWALLAFLFATYLAEDVLVFVWLFANHCWFHVMDALVRTNLFDNVLRYTGRGKSQTPSVSPGDAVSRFRGDVEGTTEVVNEWYRLLGHGLFALIAGIIMWRINPFVTVVSVLPLSGVVIVVHRLGARLAAAWAEARRETGRVTGFISETFGAILAVKVATAETRVTQHFRQISDARRRMALQHTLIDSIIGSFNNNVINIGRGLVLLLAAQPIHTGTFTIGDFTLFVIYLEQFLELPRRVGRLLAAQKVAAVSTPRLTALIAEASAATLVASRPIYLRTEPPPLEHPASAAPLQVLTMDALTYRYPIGETGIANITLQLARGTTTVITGRIGAGKTTLLRALLGLLPAASGQIFWNGTIVADPATFFIPPRVAYTPQTPRLFAETLRDNILLGLADDEMTGGREDERMGRLEEAIYAAVLEDDIAQMADGVDTLIGPRGVRLSGGQVQRAAAARMFVRQPELLVFDDLSSALDVETEQLLWSRLFAQENPPACLVVSHRRAALQRADHIVVLKDGKVEDEGQLDELLARCEEMQRLWAEEDNGL